MATKPIAGDVFYNPATDHPRVRLKSGDVDLATMDDVGGGGPHATTHENGGADEVDVSGLSGVLADAQTADTIVTPAGNVVVTGTVGSNGDVLTSDGAGNAAFLPPAGGGAASTGGWWDPPPVPHAADEEFLGTSLPVAFSAWEGTSAAPMTLLVAGVTIDTAPPSADINYAVGVSVGHAKIQVNHPRKSSRFVAQVSNGFNLFYARKIASLNALTVFRARLHGPWSGLGGNYFLMVMRDTAGVPDYTSWVRIGIRGSNLVVDYSSSGAVTLNHQSVAIGAGAGYEMCWYKHSVGRYYPFVQDENRAYELAPIDYGSSQGMFTGQPIWVGLNFEGTATADQSVMTCDYLRQQDDGDVF